MIKGLFMGLFGLLINLFRRKSPRRKKRVAISKESLALVALCEDKKAEISIWTYEDAINHCELYQTKMEVLCGRRIKPNEIAYCIHKEKTVFAYSQIKKPMEQYQLRYILSILQSTEDEFNQYLATNQFSKKHGKFVDPSMFVYCPKCGTITIDDRPELGAPLIECEKCKNTIYNFHVFEPAFSSIPPYEAPKGTEPLDKRENGILITGTVLTLITSIVCLIAGSISLFIGSLVLSILIASPFIFTWAVKMWSRRKYKKQYKTIYSPSINRLNNRQYQEKLIATSDFHPSIIEYISKYNSIYKRLDPPIDVEKLKKEINERAFKEDSLVPNPIKSKENSQTEAELSDPVSHKRKLEQLFCRKCGSELPFDSDYCYRCGEKVIFISSTDLNKDDSESDNHSINPR